MASLILPGQVIRSGAPEDVPPALKGAMEITEVHEVLVSAARGGDAPDRTHIDESAETDIVEIQLESGLKLWQSVADARRDFAGVERSIADQALLVPRVLPLSRGAERGAGDYAVRAVRLLRTNLAGKAGEMSALALAQHIENASDHGFHRCTRSASGIQLVPTGKIDAGKPMLVLVHGTFSSTSGSFDDLAVGDDLWPVLERAFPAGIFALEHRSVTVDPIENARDLLMALPKGARVTLLSHSRGGLVAELVARAARPKGEAPFDDTDRSILRKAGRDVAMLEELGALITERGLTVERMIRVAGPLRGTPLASGRLDRVLSIALNSFELIPALKASVAYELFKAYLLGFVATKADPELLPGLEAMMPRAPLVAMVNRADLRLGGALHVIAGDNEGKGLLRKLRNLALDLFFEDDNDFVVNYASMSRGAARISAPVLTPIRTAEITHFSYFGTGAARGAILAAIRSDLGAPALGGDLPIDDDPEGFEIVQSRGASDLPVCIFLPGVMGSHLYQGKNWVWSNPLQMVTGGLSLLRYPGNDVRPGNPMKRYYGDLANYLARTHHVIALPYDWRESVLTTGAGRLAAVVRKALAQTQKPIRFMAHSMGGLVVRAFIDAHPDLWAEIRRRKGSRFVMLGTPNGGAFSMVHMLMGRAKNIRQLEMADFAHDMIELLDIVSGMPGPAQLLPVDAQGHYLTRQAWQELRNIDNGPWVVPPEASLKAARAAHRLFASQSLDPDLTCYVAGLGPELTPSGLRIDQSAAPGKRVQFIATRAGDGTVTWATGIPKGIEPYYLPVVHGDLARTRSAFPALAELLEKGETSGLSRTRPALARGAQAPVVMPDAVPQIYPEPQDVVDGMLGAGGPAPLGTGSDLPVTEVTLRHGDLRFARHPVLVGHYLGDPINGGEAALDQCLDHSLSAVRELGLYPGEAKSCEVILRLGRNPGGAVVAGLGPFGDLTPGALRETVNRAVLRYAMTLRRRAAEDGKSLAEMDPIRLTSVVIGHKGANMTVQQSVQAILEAVADANLTLRDTPIAKLEFIEIYEDTVFQVASALYSASRDGRVAGLIRFDHRIRPGDGAQLRMDYASQEDSWQRIIVTRNAQRADVLDFTAITEGARAEFKKTSVQAEVIDRLLRESREGTATKRTLGKLLFELMIPIELKSFAKNDQKIQLVLDSSTAHIPWELMEDDINTFGEGLYQTMATQDFKPMVIRTPIIRQLAIEGRPVPRARLDTALVVGDSISALPPLDGARREAELVQRLLQDEAGYDVTAMIRSDSGLSVLEAALLKPTKIMHFATHGVYDDSGDIHTAGLVLSDGITLTAAELRQMRYVPEFVFLNCCHLGRVQPNVGPIAASLSQALIEKGVRAVIAAGWELDDAGALLFAESFYGSLLAGNRFGDAVHHARLKVFRRYPDTNTWGAYQCYGDPDYTLHDDAADTAWNGRRRQYYSADHACRAARNIACDVGSPHRGRDELIRELDEIERAADPDWHDNAQWTEAMGRAYAKLDIYAPAIAMLERATRGGRSDSSIGAIEMLEDLKVRKATQDWTQAEIDAASAPDDARAKAQELADTLKAQQQAVTKAALARLSALDALIGGAEGPLLTVRRESLKGSVTKRLALGRNPGAPRHAALKDMVACYESSMRLTAQADPGGPLDRHATYNWLSGHLALGTDLIEGQPLSAWFDRLLAENATAENADPEFWTAALPAEVDVLLGLLAQPQERPQIFARFETCFRHAWARGGAYAQARAIREHVAFLRFLHENDAEKADWMRRVQMFLDDLTWSYRSDQPREF
ncbi:CHAT domain-containing protein [Salipiger sp. 1_MG-2023]|uniref:CHAT domain-containing protein n=1 Tax=Salipiger sp. 1_MG-2023 TaxID=3062665 RepID=UPI0026E311A4|nr:CHAT domain-containing protein [Salipiger sp. 1_MG-2023]MDO6587444.1 CHAT domain-containing protein [Salipiger sp. 1_MG-2023]